MSALRIKKRRLTNPAHKYPEGYRGLEHSPELVIKYIRDFWHVNQLRAMKPTTYIVAGQEIVA